MNGLSANVCSGTMDSRPSPARRVSSRALVVASAVAGMAFGCSQPGDGPSAGGAAPPYQGPVMPVPQPVIPLTPAPVDAPGESSTPPIDPNGLAPTEPAEPEPEGEAPLSADEQAQLSAFDGLVRAVPWNAAATTSVTETTVGRAYLDWKSRFYKTCDDGTVYVLKDDYTGTQQVVSEGIAYGMLLSVGIGDRAVFDGLWQFYENRRNGNGVMNWRFAVCGGQTDANGASDADLDAAMGLIIAESRWGGYAEDARNLVNAIADSETETCGDGHMVLKAGDAYGGCDGRVNPSYFSPAYYRRFAQFTPERADLWNKLTEDTYAMLFGMQEEVGGLLPDWGSGDGRVEAGSEQYGYEAVRAPWRIVTDLGWSNSEDARSFLQRMSQTIDSRGGIAAMADDASFEDKRNSAFLGSLSLSGASVDQAKFDSYVAEWQAYEDVDDSWYYQATLKVLFLMTAGGYFPAEF
jgi:endo-1,4-beta-D-glucanase Y